MLDPKSQRIGNSGRRFGVGAAEGTDDRLERALRHVRREESRSELTVMP